MVNPATSSATVPTRACRRPTVERATTAARRVILRATAPTSKWTTASATTAALSDTSRGIVRRVAEAEAKLQHRTMTARPATSELRSDCGGVFASVH